MTDRSPRPEHPAAPPSSPPPEWTSPEPQTDAEAPKSSDWRMWAIAAAVAVVVLVAGFALLGGGGGGGSDAAAGGAAAASGNAAPQGGGAAPGGFGGGAFGEVVAIEGTTLTVESTGGPSGDTSTVTVETDADTEFDETIEGSLDDLADGDEVVVVGDDADGTITAISISEGAGLGAGGGFAGGAPSGDLQPPDGADLPDLPDGAQLPDGFEPGQGFDPSQRPGGAGGGLVTGTITSIDGSTVTIDTDDGEVVVLVDDDTTVSITVPRSFSDIELGDTISATGDSEDSVVAATRVQIGDLGFGRGAGPGGGFPPQGDDSTTD